MTTASNMSKNFSLKLSNTFHTICLNESIIHFLFRFEGFRGVTAFVMDKFEATAQMKMFYNLLLDARNKTYWVVFTEKEINSSENIVKTVYPGFFTFQYIVDDSHFKLLPNNNFLLSYFQLKEPEISLSSGMIIKKSHSVLKMAFSTHLLVVNIDLQEYFFNENIFKNR